MTKEHLEKREQEMLEFVDLSRWRDSLVSTLSGGMKHRVSLACALIHEPTLVFLDEPTVGVDPELRATFWGYFESLVKKGITVIITTHYMDEARSLLTRWSPSARKTYRRWATTGFKKEHGDHLIRRSVSCSCREGKYHEAPRTLAFSRRALLQFRHDRRTLAFVLIMPLFMILIFGYTFGGDVKNITIEVVNHDTGLQPGTSPVSRMVFSLQRRYTEH